MFSVTFRKQDPPWFYNEIKLSLRQRRRAYISAKRSNHIYLWTKYKSLRNKSSIVVRRAKQNYFDKLATKLKTSNNCTDFWKTVKLFTSLSPSSHDTQPLLCNGNIYETNYDKANILNNYVNSQIILQVPDNVNLSSSNAVEQSLHDFDISIEDVVDSIKMLKTGKAVGLDSINSYVLREIAHDIASPLRDLFSGNLLMFVPSSRKLILRK